MNKLIAKVKDFASQKRHEFIFLIGMSLVVIGSFLLFVFPHILKIGFDMNFKLQKGKFIFDNWKDLPVPLSTRMYLFDIQNPDEFKNGQIAVIREIGPYTYKQFRSREILEWSEDNRKVKFMETSTFHFDEQNSVGPLTDKLTLINVPLLIVFSIINTAVEMFPLTPVISPIVNNVVNTLLVTHRERLIETRTVGEVVNGRRISLLDTIDIVAKPLRMMGLPIPEYGISSYKLRDNTYGFLAIRNDSTFGPFEAYTGAEDTQDKFAHIISYQGKRRLGIYRHESCDAINGTDGSFFGTFPDISEPLYVTNVHACRSLRFDYSHDTTVNGVSAYRYEMSENIFDGPEYNRQNWCFCPKGVQPKKCHGLLDMGQCLAGVPFAMTLPHFLTSPRFLSGVRGLNPDRDKHMGYFDIEKTLGVTLRGFARIQVNLKLRPFTFVPGLNNFRPTLLPYLWMEEGAIVDGFLGYLLKAGSWSINGAHYAFIVTVLLGTGIALMSSVTIYKKRREENKMKKTVKQTNESSNYEDNHTNDILISNRKADYIPPIIDLEWNSDPESGISRMTANATNDGIYPNLNQMNGQINTIAKTVETPNLENNNPFLSDNRRKESIESQTSRKSIESQTSRKSVESQISNRAVIEERHSGHSERNEVLLAPVENGGANYLTTLIIQRKPYPHEVNNMPSVS